MRRTLTLLLILCLSYPIAWAAQGDDGILERLSDAMSQEKWEDAEKLFRQAVAGNVEKAETFFWTVVGTDCKIRKAMALELGSYFKNNRSYEKAYPFYKELIDVLPQNVEYLSACAELEVLRGKESNALSLYEKILTLDLNHLPANIFVGNYYYLLADQKKQKLDKDYKKIQSPTKMQYAGYRGDLDDIVHSGYAKAKVYLERVMTQFPSTEVKKTLDKIRLVERENLK